MRLPGCGTPRGEGLPLLTPPPEREIAQAEQTLFSLGLVDADGHPTAFGTRVAGMPVGVREARALLDGARTLRGEARPRSGTARVLPGSDGPRFVAEGWSQRSRTIIGPSTPTCRACCASCGRAAAMVRGAGAARRTVCSGSHAGTPEAAGTGAGRPRCSPLPTRPG